MKNNQNNTGSLKLPQAIDFSMNQRVQFNSPRFTVEETGSKINSSSLKQNLISANKAGGVKASLSNQQLINQQLSSTHSQQQLAASNQLINSLSASSLNSSPKLFSFNQEQKRGYSAKKKENSGQQDSSQPSSIQGYVQKFFQQQQQQQQSSTASGSQSQSIGNQNQGVDIGTMSKQQLRKTPVQAPYMMKKNAMGNYQTIDLNLNAISPSSTTVSGTSNISLQRKSSHRKTQSQLINSQTPSSYSHNYQLPPYQRSIDISGNEFASQEEKSASKSNVGQDKTFGGISQSKGSIGSTNKQSLPQSLSASSQTSPLGASNKNQILLSNFITKVNKDDPSVKMSSLFQPSSPYFSQQTSAQEKYSQQNAPSNQGIQLPESQSKSARSTPKQHNLFIEQSLTPKQSGVELGYHPYSAKNSQSKKTFRSNLISSNLQANQRGNRSSSGHITLNINSQNNQKGDILLQKKLEQINTERTNTGKSYSFSQGQFQQVLQNVQNPSSKATSPNSGSSSSSNNGMIAQHLQQTQQQQLLGSKLSSNHRKSNTIQSPSQLQYQSTNEQEQHRGNTPLIKKAKIDPRKKPISQSELDREENGVSASNQPLTERQKRKEVPASYNIPTHNLSSGTSTNQNYKDKIVKQQHQLSLLVSQQKQEQMNDFDYDVKDKTDEKETQSCESENSSINNNNNLKKNLNNSSENTTPVHNPASNNTHNSNKKTLAKKHLDKAHPEQSYYHHGLVKSFKTPYPMDPISVIFRQHFLQTCQGVLYSNLARPVNPKDLVSKRVQLGPRNPKYKKTLIFDMDETLIHCNENANAPCDVVVDVKFPTGEFIQAGINVRPYAIEILQELSEEFEIVIFTASHSCYAQAVIDFLDPQKKYVHHRYYRDQCIQTPQGVYIKDLRVFTDRLLSEIVLIDNAAYSFSFQVDNGIPIIPFYDNKSDNELLHLTTYLRNLLNVDDVRSYNRTHLKMFFFNEPEGPQKVYDNLLKKSS